MRLPLLLPLLLMIAACTYQIEIQQGNVITQAQLSELTLGMSRQRVSYLLGSPLLTDPFHAQRWDYLFSLRSDERPDQRYRVTLFFGPEGTLERFEQQGELPEEAYIAGGETMGLE
ncbi:outer membrane protein assembly factor BamE [Ectothiorhodospiraceae bacterium BW-2]|nr:outer membrane protein assembly factor BamE [Ectothiorhodospiraceae bacterium BW-2]